MSISEVAVVGNPHFGPRIADALTEVGCPSRFFSDPRQSLGHSTVYLIGGHWGTRKWKAFVSLHRALGHRLFMHWIGTDVQRVLDAARLGTLDRFGLSWVTHLVEVPWLQDELALAGIEASLYPLVSTTIDVDAPMSPFPKAFNVLTYLPAHRPEFYGSTDIFQAVEKIDGMHLTVLASNADDHPWTPERATFVGWQSEVDRLIDNSVAYVRLVDHDGLSFTVTECLAAGRHVLWSYPMEGCQQVTSPDDLIERLRVLHEKHSTGALELNLPGSSHLAQELSPNTVYSRIASLLSA